MTRSSPSPRSSRVLRAENIASLVAEVEGLEAQHSHFHEDAGELIVLINSGQIEEAQTFLNEEVELEIDELQDELERIEPTR